VPNDLLHLHKWCQVQPHCPKVGRCPQQVVLGLLVELVALPVVLVLMLLLVELMR